MDPKMMPKLLAVFLLMEAVVVGGIVGATYSAQMGVLIGVGALALPVVLIPPILWWMGKLTRWHVLAARYPGTAPAPDADGGKLISMSMRHAAMGMNNCIVWHTDDLHLHLSMVWPFGAFSKPMSIPWGVIESIDEAKLGRVKITADEIGIWVPKEVTQREVTVRAAMAQSEMGSGVDAVG